MCSVITACCIQLQKVQTSLCRHWWKCQNHNIHASYTESSFTIDRYPSSTAFPDFQLCRQSEADLRGSVAVTQRYLVTTHDTSWHLATIIATIGLDLVPGQYRYTARPLLDRSQRAMHAQTLFSDWLTQEVGSQRGVYVYVYTQSALEFPSSLLQADEFDQHWWCS